MASNRETTSSETEIRSGGTFDKILMATAQTLIPMAIAAGLVSWGGSWRNADAIEQLQKITDRQSETMIGIVKTLEAIAIINERQTVQLRVLDRDVGECRVDIKDMKGKR
ncbi:MAG: hypothetical protein JAY60_19620 [Candidatus Thiodiazotropha weberae]|nr:hypothetical protein [Candidatus Thiodiazotropha weberae]